MNKKELIAHLESLLKQNIEENQKALQDIKSSMAAETKSSAGDKHETSREMMNQSRDQVENQIHQAEKQLHELNNLPFDSQKITQGGSLLRTNHESFFFGLAMGKVVFQDEVIFALSINSPIGQAFHHKQVNDQVNFRGKSYQIKSIE